MPYAHETRRTVTLNLPVDEYAALAQDALDAGYATPGTYALALVRARGDAPDPIVDQRTADRINRLEGKNEWLLHQFEALQAKLTAAGGAVYPGAGAGQRTPSPQLGGPGTGR